MTIKSLSQYEPIIGEEKVWELQGLAAMFAGARIVHVSSTRGGGDVWEVLDWMVPLMRELGMDASWEIIGGDEAFFEMAWALRNGLQGGETKIDSAMEEAYAAAMEQSVKRLAPTLESADFVIVHDPQPAGLLALVPTRQGKWLWRCHLDSESPDPTAWELVKKRVEGFDAAVFSTESSAKEVGERQVIIPPSIDPLSPRNVELSEEDVDRLVGEVGVTRDLPLITQVAPIEPDRDPLGVIEAFRDGVPKGKAQLLLAGEPVDDDPDGIDFLSKVRDAAAKVEGAEVLLLPPDAHETINALHRASTIVVQKSLHEGFGLAVAEALWKGKPVIAGDTTGYRQQITEGETGYIVRSATEAGARMAKLLESPELAHELGEAGQKKAKEELLFDRELSKHLAALIALR